MDRFIYLRYSLLDFLEFAVQINLSLILVACKPKALLDIFNRFYFIPLLEFAPSVDQEWVGRILVHIIGSNDRKAFAAARPI